jgi:hypothetical protein
LKRHKSEQHAPKKTCPLAECQYKGTKRKALLMGEGTHKGHLEKKHGLSREGMPNQHSMPLGIDASADQGFSCC